MPKTVSVKCIYWKFYKIVVIPKLKVSNKSTLASSFVSVNSFGTASLRQPRDRIKNILFLSLVSLS